MAPFLSGVAFGGVSQPDERKGAIRNRKFPDSPDGSCTVGAVISDGRDDGRDL
jgi:hypothetical protein